jgi:hypothetical protein
VIDVGALRFIPRAFVYVALAAWTLTMLGLIRKMTRRRSSPVS